MSENSTGNKNFFLNGSAWLRADFHLHTNADQEFDYDGEESWFISNYIQALKTAEIKVAVITNHNKFDLSEYKALEKLGRKEGILLLPGVELSVKDGKSGIHVLWSSGATGFLTRTRRTTSKVF